MGSALNRTQGDIDLVAKAKSLGVASAHINGMSLPAVHEAAHQAVEQVRSQQTPFFLELHTYRFRAHSMFDPELYRDKAEVERWKQHDPIEHFAGLLKGAGLATDADIEASDLRAVQEVEAAVQFAEAGTWEPVAELLDNVVAAL
jgi:pyruvate dehydrogenase E1 component alpha subunit